jgi:glycerol-1-phosphate dehydrogenase [NAD(P)+]
MSDPLLALLRGDWTDPDTGAQRGIDIASIAIERDLRGQEAALVAALGFGKRIAVVSDRATHEVMGARVEAALAGISRVDSIVLARDRTPTSRPSRWCARRPRAPTRSSRSGPARSTISRSSPPRRTASRGPCSRRHIDERLHVRERGDHVDGHKKTLPASLARGVFVDLAVLSAAPPRMIRAGLGDSLCRSTAQVDWLLSRECAARRTAPAPFALLADGRAAAVRRTRCADAR